MGTLTQSIHVTCTTAGIPLRMLYGGRSYTVKAEPQRWYVRRRWWAEEHRAELGHGPGLVDYQVWRVQVSLTRAQNAPILTLDISHHIESGRWRLVQVHDAMRLEETA
ncbi:hypothetical protein GCM10009720_24420 [Yaniella flava]|uniref:DUF6504 domain-containing protein n=1 Tax=Yaniella flava TaxID=287930 RepID=A0ABN2UU09_9MICC|nr:hypothetical protein [Micrococcaceae bacterium]